MSSFRFRLVAEKVFQHLLASGQSFGVSTTNWTIDEKRDCTALAFNFGSADEFKILVQDRHGPLLAGFASFDEGDEYVEYSAHIAVWEDGQIPTSEEATIEVARTFAEIGETAREHAEEFANPGTMPLPEEVETSKASGIVLDEFAYLPGESANFEKPEGFYHRIFAAPGCKYELVLATVPEEKPTSASKVMQRVFSSTPDKG